MSIGSFERELPEVLQWNPKWLIDPVPEWWMREIGEEAQRELIAIRLETQAAVLNAQAAGMAAAAEAVRGRRQV